MSFVIHANLDCEARWAGQPLPHAVATRASYYAALLAALAPDGQATDVWAPAAIDARRLIATPGWIVPSMHVGAPPSPPDLAWARADAQPANDRRLALEVATSVGCALPGARAAATMLELEAAITAIAGGWIAKAPWTTAGRDRCRGDGPLSTEQRTRLGRLLDGHGALVVEPWMTRVLDVGVCATLRGRALITERPHGVVTDARGGFLGIDLAPPALTDDELRSLTVVLDATAAALRGVGFDGPFAIDAFAYQVDGDRRFHPLCEINARTTFGWVARALHRRCGTTRLGLGAAPPGATTLIAPERDGVTAWIA